MNKSNSWCVYMHINKINNKKYIGITCKKPEYRWNYGKGYKYNPHFWNAIQKYGWDNFKHIIILQNETHDYACKVEKCLIKHYNTMNPLYGYNHTSGGDSGFKHTGATKQKISAANKGEKNSNYGVSPKNVWMQKHIGGGFISSSIINQLEVTIQCLEYHLRIE